LAGNFRNKEKWKGYSKIDKRYRSVSRLTRKISTFDISRTLPYDIFSRYISNDTKISAIQKKISRYKIRENNWIFHTYLV
jgi:hypothetical protein